MSKDNVLIAEFMNLESELLAKGLFQRKYKHSFSSHGFSDWASEEMLEFHSSWNWLMPVVEKIRETAGALSSQDPIEKQRAFLLFSLGITTPIKTVYIYAVNYIKYYNKANETN